MCDVMPTISEDGNSSQGDRDSQASGEGTNVEDMLLSILDERDRLMESLHDAQDQLVFTQNRLAEAERERDVLNRQLSEKLPEVLSLKRILPTSCGHEETIIPVKVMKEIQYNSLSTSLQRYVSLYERNSDFLRFIVTFKTEIAI
ncbi:unnamed protein product [Schistosoma margrebowiei]|uniref:Uncharacterized protein n=1 Tax=Schistosoma margrebowiei TaxID=48269 RepID=A0A183N796_9TREM|nr:unnamed protein product [Schistosoma margrebowiei]